MADRDPNCQHAGWARGRARWPPAHWPLFYLPSAQQRGEIFAPLWGRLYDQNRTL